MKPENYLYESYYRVARTRTLAGYGDGRSMYQWRLSAWMEGDEARDETQGCIHTVTESGNVAGTGAAAMEHTKAPSMSNMKQIK
jgi:hypothetical protein